MKSIKRYEIKCYSGKYERMQIGNSQQAYDYIKQFYSDDIDIYESFYLLLLNHSNIVIGYAKISQGGIAGTVVDKKILFKYIIDSLSSGFILAHNHPSGSLKPSQQDRDITQEIKEITKLFDSQLLDHIILTSDGFYSFSDNGDL